MNCFVIEYTVLGIPCLKSLRFHLPANVQALALGPATGISCRKPSRTGEYGPTAAAAGGSGNGSYHLSLLLEAPAESKEGDVAKGGGSSAAFDFVCSSSGVQAPEEARLDGGDSEGAVGFDRVCALRGEVVHIFTFFHRPDGVADKSSGEL